MRHTLIHHAARARTWPDWLELAGFPGLEPAGTLTFDSMADGLEAAAAGQGIAFGFEPLLWATPLGARLTPAFPEGPSIEASYYLIHRAGPSPPVVTAFLDWLRREAAQRGRPRPAEGFAGP